MSLLIQKLGYNSKFENELLNTAVFVEQDLYTVVRLKCIAVSDSKIGGL